VPPVITHTKLGTLYEEPCMVYIKVGGVMRCDEAGMIL
jgi:hypothetical protein